MTNKFVMSKAFMSALLLTTGIVFTLSCNKQGMLGPDIPHQSTSSMATGEVSLSGTPGTLRVITIAGKDTQGYVDGISTTAAFYNPAGVVADRSGNVYIADMSNHVIRKMTSAGVVSTLAGNGTPGFTNAQGSAAQFNNPTGVAVDAGGNVYVADKGNHIIRKITPAGEVTTLAGIPGSPGSTDGPGTAAQFNNPAGLTIDVSGNILIADAGNHKIRSISPAGFVNTVAGNGTQGGGDGVSFFAQFNAPAGVAADASGNVYVADAGNNKIRKIAGGIVSTLAGGGANGSTPGFVDATGTAALFASPTGVAIDVTGNVFVTDKANHAIRQVTSAGIVTTLTGNGTAGFADGLPALARFNSPAGISIDASGNLFIADQRNNRIREIGIIATVTTLAGSGTTGFWGGGFADGAADIAKFNHPTGIAISAAGYSSGDVFVGDLGNNRIRYIAPSDFFNSSTHVNTQSGSDPGYRDVYNGWFVSQGLFNGPAGIAIDDSATVYIADEGNHAIRKMSAAGLFTLAGNGSSGFADGQGTSAKFNVPTGVAVDVFRNVYVADEGNNRIRKITPAGLVSTLAGNGAQGFADGDGATAAFNFPTGVAVDAAGNVYVADQGNNRIRKITTTGVVSTLAGSGVAGFADGAGTAAAFDHPYGIAVDASGNIYVADTYNHRIRKITQAGMVSTLAGSGISGFSGGGLVDGLANLAKFSFPEGVAVDASGAVYVADVLNHRIRKIQ